MIIGVHGIAKQQLGRRQLLRDWEPALRDGLELAGARRDGPVNFDLAFYGNVFPPVAVPGHKSNPSEDPLENLDDDEAEDLSEAAHELLTEHELAQAQGQEPKGYNRLPPGLTILLRALDKKFGPSAGVLYLGTMRQVRRYLRSETMKTQVDEIVRAAVLSDCRVLIGHSLGSVLALEYVRQHPEHPFDLLLTLGSPLALRMVQSRMPEPRFGSSSPSGIPSSVTAWVNVRDVRDPVACAGDLAPLWPGAQDRHVHNGSDAHSVTRYLGKIETGSAILALAGGAVGGGN
jgi:hypothetical protein